MQVFVYSLLAGLSLALPHKPRQAAQVIQHCTQPNTIALTYDDGPYTFGPALLDQLDAAGIKATFFVNGQNWDNIYNHRPTIGRIVDSGHQLGSHTYNHADLTTLNADGIRNEITSLDAALLEIVGRRPTYLRAPYLAVNDEVTSVASSLDYRMVGVDIDTQDWGFSIGETSIAEAFGTVTQGVAQGNSIVLMHETNEETVFTLTPQIIAYIQQNGLRAVTVGECLGDAPENWYRWA